MARDIFTYYSTDDFNDEYRMFLSKINIADFNEGELYKKHIKISRLIVPIIPKNALGEMENNTGQPRI